MPNVDLSVTCEKTSWGEEVAVLGSWNSWNKNNITKLRTTSDLFPKWHTQLQLADQLSGKSIEYKYVIVKDGAVSRWEGKPGMPNRVALIQSQTSVSDVFGKIPTSPSNLHHSPSQLASTSKSTSNSPVSVHAAMLTTPHVASLDSLESSILRITVERKSWRQRLSYIRSLFTDPEVAADVNFHTHSIDALATVSIYLTFLASGQLKCEEDGGHYRPNHHANEARQIESALSAITHTVLQQDRESVPTTSTAYLPYVIRKIFPQLPSYSSQFTASVPLTRIRDIAHRGDIPHDLKQEIKHTLQNKLHRCAGPEDLQTSARLLERINHGHYNEAFKEQFNIFHAELRAFFNASSLHDRLHYLQNNSNTQAVATLSSTLLAIKQANRGPITQLELLSKLRGEISCLEIMQPPLNTSENELPSEDIQKIRLADIDLESYAFLLLAAVAKQVEEDMPSSRLIWSYALNGLSYAMQNMQYSTICPSEAKAIAAELTALSQILSNSTSPPMKITLLRAKAGVERAVRFAHEFSNAISDVYSRRALSLGRALGVDEHALSVFAEAEIRANVTFQASRIAQACASACRKALAMPAWDPVFAGVATGKVVFADALGDVSGGGEDVVVVCRRADGDEDIAKNIRAVVLGRELAHLSHLGVRARQAGVVFVCAEEQEAFDKVWKRRDLNFVKVVVSGGEGLIALEEVDRKEHGRENGSKKKENSGIDRRPNVTYDGSLKEVVNIEEATLGTTSSKCTFAGKLKLMAGQSNGLFEAADGVALPHGIFQAQVTAHSGKYKKLVSEYIEAHKTEGDTDTVAKKIFSFIEEEFVLNANICKRLENRFRKECKVMVRSSANAEDLEDMSGAGLYDSIANVQVDAKEELRKAVAKVWASLWTKRAASSRAAYGIPHEEVSMAVLIQEMVPSSASFVGFSQDPVSKNIGNVYVEAAIGVGETLASGVSAGSPYRMRVLRDGYSVQTVAMASYSRAWVAGESDGLIGRVVDYSTEAMTWDNELREELVERIARTVMYLEKVFGGPQDVEGAIVIREGNVRLFVVQARPQILSK